MDAELKRLLELKQMPQLVDPDNPRLYVAERLTARRMEATGAQREYRERFCGPFQWTDCTTEKNFKQFDILFA